MHWRRCSGSFVHYTIFTVPSYSTWWGSSTEMVLLYAHTCVSAYAYTCIYMYVRLQVSWQVPNTCTDGNNCLTAKRKGTWHMCTCCTGIGICAPCVKHHFTYLNVDTETPSTHPVLYNPYASIFTTTRLHVRDTPSKRHTKQDIKRSPHKDF